MPMVAADEAVLEVLREDILNPEAIALAIETTVHKYAERPGDLAEQPAAIEADVRRVEAEIEPLIDALAGGDPLVSVRNAIKAREQRRAELHARLEHVDGLAKLPRVDTRALKAEVTERLKDWRGLLSAEPVAARQIVRKLLNGGRLVFTPDVRRGVYTFTGTASYGRLLAGVVGQKEWCPRGDSNTRHAV